jgi:hypothetical protein
MSKLRSSPSGFSWFFSTIFIVVGFLVFGYFVYKQYSSTSPEALNQGSKTPVERAQILSDVRANQLKLTSEYAWIDEDKGIVRLPIKRAMELTLEELQSRKN